MAQPLHTVDAGKCRGDGICVEICPKDVLEIRDGKAVTVESAARHCLRCGHCVAVCPNEAIVVDGIGHGDLGPAATWNIPFDVVIAMLRSRRSVRVFADKPVERAVIDQVIAAAAEAPPAFPPHATGVVVLTRPEDRERLVKALVQGYDKLVGAMGNPIGRMIIRWKRGAETVRAIKDHVLQIVSWDNERFRARGVDRYTYGAPVVMLFHADRATAGYQESAMIVATYAMLGAHALGLGATMLSIVPPVINNVATDLKRNYGIPDGDAVVVALIVGHPKYRFRRTFRRTLKRVRHFGTDGAA